MTTVSNNVNQLAAEKGIAVIGSYKPADIGCTRDEFFDPNHPRASCLNKMFSAHAN